MITKEDKVKLRPFLAKGSLKFKESKHSLVRDGLYYRCSQQSKGRCKNTKERLIKIRDFEKKLDKVIDKFKLPDGDGGKICDSLLPTFFQSFSLNLSQDLNNNDVLEPTVNVMIESLKNGKDIDKKDLLEFKRRYIESLKIAYSNMLFGYMVDTLMFFGRVEPGKNPFLRYTQQKFKLGAKYKRQKFVLNVKTFYLSNDGNIENLEFEGWAWYMLNYFNKFSPFYLHNLPSGLILNTKKFESLDYNKVLTEFAKNNYRDTYSTSIFATKYAKEKILKKIFSGIENLTNRQKIDYLMKLNTPSHELIYSIFAAAFQT